MRLQHIIALKFFGFELLHMKSILSSEMNLAEYLSAQSQHLKEKAKALLDESHALDDVLGYVPPHESLNSHLPWEMIIKTIEVYQMTQKLEHLWVKDRESVV